MDRLCPQSAVQLLIKNKTALHFYQVAILCTFSFLGGRTYFNFFFFFLRVALTLEISFKWERSIFYFIWFSATDLRLVSLVKKRCWSGEGYVFIFTLHINWDVPVTFLHPSPTCFAFSCHTALLLASTTGPLHRLSPGPGAFLPLPFLTTHLLDSSQPYLSLTPVASLACPSVLL